MWQFPPQGLGWRPDLPDPRDFTPEHEQAAALLTRAKGRRRCPAQVDSREYCGPLGPSRPIRLGTARAALDLVSYFVRRATGEALDPSWLFVHQTASRLMPQCAGEFRTTWKAIVQFGVPDQRHWPCRAANFHQRPDPFVYQCARRLPALRYLRLDGRALPGEAVLTRLRSFLAAGFACALGVPMCSAVTADPDIPFPTVFDRICGGQALVAVGYDDHRYIRSDRGALLVRNGWGGDWGDGGYGYLPYAYVRERLASDIWTLVEPDWVSSGEFTRPE